ncbi:MAG TPA: AMP-binding protein [Solirubrobacteraceae bacterium]|nr:AMP-binding protein [Solirubrobacteraceae bacterium]
MAAVPDVRIRARERHRRRPRSLRCAPARAGAGGAVRMAEQPGVRCGARFCTYEQLYDGSLRATRGLVELGVGPGDRVALLLHNSIEFVQASLATVPVGAVRVPINWHWRAEEVAYVLADSSAKALVVHAGLLGAIRASIPEGLLVIAVPADAQPLQAGACGDRARDLHGSPLDGVLWWPDWLAQYEPWAQAPESAPASMIYTSGTTGRPKGVVRSPPTDSQREATSALFGEIFQLAPGERTVIPAPLYHSAPNAYASAAVLRGMHMTLMTSFDAEEFLRIVAEERITVVQMVPTMFVRLLALPERVRSRYELSSLRWVVHAAAPCPPQVKRAMIEWWGPIVAEYYGGTETGPVTFATSEEWLARPGTVGRALAQATVKILDGDARELPAGESGEVFMRLDVLSDFTYEGDPRKRRAVERNGLISCGDIGYLDAEGYLYLNDRASDMVISGGVNIYPAEIEACLLSLPGVRDCAVFGIPDEQFGEALAAHVELDDGAQLSAEDVRAHVHARLAAYKTPRVVELVQELPREDSGKIFKRRLRDPYWAGRDRAV